MSRSKEADRAYRQKRKESDISFMENASEERKALWVIERQLSTRFDKRNEYMSVIDRLIEITPIESKRSGGGKHGRPINTEREGDLEGMRVNLKRF